MSDEKQSRITQLVQPEEDPADVLELTEEADEPGEPANDDDKGDVFVQIGEEEVEVDPLAANPNWQQMRQALRDKNKRIKELEAEKGVKDEPKLSARPKLEDFEYDQAAYDAAVDKWYEDRRAIEVQETEAQAQQRKAEERWQAKLARLEQDKAALGAEDISDVEDEVRENLSVTQQGIIVQGCKNAAQVFYALGKSPARLRELAAIDDPVEFAFEIARMEGQVKVGRKPPPPEGKLVARGKPGNAATDNTLERLRAEAAKTGDYTKVAQYRRDKKAAAK